MNERFASVPEITLTADADATDTNTIDADFIADKQTFAINSDIDELVGDGKIQEFIQYIEHIDSETPTGDKLDFKEFSEESKRIRYPSYNVGGEVDEEIDEFTIIVADDGNEAVETDEETTVRNESQTSKRFEIKRKSNMFANDTTRFIKYEQMNEAKQLQSASVSDEVQPVQKAREVLFKSKTVDQNLSSANFAPDAGADENDASKSEQNDPDIRVIESPSIDAITRGESLASDLSGESSYIIFKRCSDSESASGYAREDSWMSNESNVRYDRSESTFSDLEYIRGRDDWKDQHRITSEIESDNYHHGRRFSENSDTLEFIRGREDWLKNEMSSLQSSTLPRIFEHGDRKFLIQDEIDSDEYHHHTFYVQEAVRTATELGPRFLVHGSARNGRARSPYKVLHADIDKNEFMQRYYWQGADHSPSDESGFESMALERRDLAEEKMIRNERLIWIQNENSRSQSPLAVDVNAIKVTKSESAPPTASIEGPRLSSECDVEYEEEIRTEEINEVIDNIIDAQILTEDTLQKSPSEDIEIMVLDLAEKKPKRSKQFTEPLIIVSEAPDEVEASTDETKQESDEVIQSDSALKQEIVEDDVDMESFEIVNAPNLNDEPHIEHTKSINDAGTNTVIETPTAVPHVNRSDANQTKINEKSVQKTKKGGERFDDLIQESSMGLWFHK